MESQYRQSTTSVHRTQCSVLLFYFVFVLISVSLENSSPRFFSSFLCFRINRKQKKKQIWLPFKIFTFGSQINTKCIPPGLIKTQNDVHERRGESIAEVKKRDVINRMATIGSKATQWNVFRCDRENCTHNKQTDDDQTKPNVVDIANNAKILAVESHLFIWTYEFLWTTATRSMYVNFVLNQKHDKRKMSEFRVKLLRSVWMAMRIVIGLLIHQLVCLCMCLGLRTFRCRHTAGFNLWGSGFRSVLCPSFCRPISSYSSFSRIANRRFVSICVCLSAVSHHTQPDARIRM